MSRYTQNNVDDTDAALHVSIHSLFRLLLVFSSFFSVLSMCAHIMSARAHMHVVLIFHIISFALGEVIFAKDVA